MRKPTNATAIKFQETIKQHGLSGEAVEFENTTKTAADAAAAIGCELGQIVKSLIFRGGNSGDGIIILTSGSNRVDERLVESVIGEPLAKADADFVRTLTGFAIGGVPPFGYPHPAHTYMDEDLNQYSEIWAAAGTPNAVFPLTPAELLQLTKAKTIRVHQ